MFDVPQGYLDTRQTRPHRAECQKRTVTSCSWLVRSQSETTAPEIVSSARMVITVMVCIWLTSRRNVAENVRVLSLFGTLPGNDRGRAGKSSPSPRAYGERVGVRAS